VLVVRAALIVIIVAAGMLVVTAVVPVVVQYIQLQVALVVTVSILVDKEVMVAVGNLDRETPKEVVRMFWAKMVAPD
jgi:hypothetical protein